MNALQFTYLIVLNRLVTWQIRHI